MEGRLGKPGCFGKGDMMSGHKGDRYCADCGVSIGPYTAGGLCPGPSKPATAEPPEWKEKPQLVFNRIMSAGAEAARKAKENWIEHYIFVSGTQWGDTPPTREEAERAWDERHTAEVHDAMISGTTIARQMRDAPPAVGETFTMDGRQFTVIEAAQTAPGTHEEIIDRVTDGLAELRAERARLEAEGLLTPVAVAEFNARRIAKREMNPAPGITDILHEALCRRDEQILARAMSIDLHHTIYDLIRPWRGK